MDRPQLLQEKGRSEAQQNQIPSEPAGSASKQEKFVRPLRRPALPLLCWVSCVSLLSKRGPECKNEHASGIVAANRNIFGNPGANGVE